jgi:hypothetical protein
MISTAMEDTQWQICNGNSHLQWEQAFTLDLMGPVHDPLIQCSPLKAQCCHQRSS